MPQLPFSMEEYNERLRKIRERMAVEGIDVLLLTKPDNIYYVSGYKASVLASSIGAIHALSVPASGEPRLITRVVEEITTTNTQWTPSPILHRDEEDPFPLLAAELREMGASDGIIGIEKRFANAMQMERIDQLLPGATFKDASLLVESVTTSSSEAEVECVRKAAQVTDAGFRRGLDVAGEGTYVYEIAGEIYNAMFKTGLSDLFAGSLVGTRTPWVGVWSGPDGGYMHDTSTSRKLEKGDLVTIEVWGSYNHYSTAAQGTIYIGKSPSEEVASAYKMVSDMYLAARGAIKAGARTGEPWEAANKIYRASQGADYFRSVGFSKGISVSTIQFGKGGTDIIPVGLPFMLHIYIAKPVCLVCVSTVLVTPTGVEELTTPLIELMTKA